MANGACASSHYLSNARDVHFYGPTTFNTAGGNISLHPQSVALADLEGWLPHVSDATHSDTRKICTRGTRLSVIRKVTAWAGSPIGPNSHVFFLTGCVGSGKSTISQTVSGDFRKEGRLGGCFYFSRDSPREQSTILSNFVASTLARQLANAFPETAPFIRDASRPQPQHVFRQIRVDDQLQSLILTPFKAVWDRGGFPRHLWPIIFVIDGLDACEEFHQAGFVNAILEFFNRNPLIPLRFFITTRMVPDFVGAPSKEEAIHQDLGDYESDDDIYTFLVASFSPRILERNRVVQSYMKQENLPWPLPWDLRSLSRHAKGSFRLASDMVDYILGPSNDGLTPIERLPRALKMDPKLDALYMQIFPQHQHLPNFFDIISTMTMTTTPLSITSLAELLDLKTHKVTSVLQNLRSVIRVPENDDEPVTFYHDSLRDFFRDQERSAQFYVSPANYLKLSYRCFLRSLRHGPMSNPADRTPAAAYSIANCTVYWRYFLKGCEQDLADEIENFSRTREPALQAQGLSRHAFLSSLFSWELFHQVHSSFDSAPFLSYFFMNWAKQLGKAVEEGPRSTIATWFNLRIGQVIQCGPFWETRFIELSRDAFQAFLSDVHSASNLVEEQLSGALDSLRRSPRSRALWAVVNDPRSHSLSPAMMLAALASAKSHPPVGESGYSVVLSINKEGSSSISEPEMYDDSDNSDEDEDEDEVEDEELEEIQRFLESQPDPCPYISYKLCDRTVHIQ